MVYCSCAENTNSSKFFDIKASPLVRICLINGDVYLAKIYIQTSYRYLYREWIVISSKKARVGKFCPDLFADVYRSAAKYTSIKMWGTVKSFALQRVKSKTAPLVKGKPPVFHEIKSTHYRSNFTRVQPGFHTAKQYFTHPQGGFHWKKDKSKRLVLFSGARDGTRTHTALTTRTSNVLVYHSNTLAATPSYYSLGVRICQ